MSRFLLIALVALLAGSVTAGTAGGATGKTVVIKDIDFHPKVLSVSKGAKVTWQFRDTVVSHNVTSYGKTHFHSSTSRMTGSYAVTFAKAGTYLYRCTIHANMFGKVIVR